MLFRSFTPQTAGYYLIVVGIQCSTNVTTKNSLMVYKNGAMATQLYYDSGDVLAGSTLVYCNGSTDYIEVYFYAPSSYTATAGATKTYFQGMWMRS